METRGLHLASPFRRLMAGVVESLVFYIALFAVLTPLGVIGALLDNRRSSASQTAGAAIGGIGFLLICGLSLAYLAITLYLWTQGMSLGKWLLGMQVVHEDGRPAGFWTMLVREIIGKPLSALVFYLGYLWVLIDREHQGWHDKLVRTWVVMRSGSG